MVSRVLDSIKMTHKPTIAIVTPYHHYLGGVESVNAMLGGIFLEEGFGVQFVTQELLENSIQRRVQKKLFGLNRVLSEYFNKYHAGNVDVVICNGEFALGVDHPHSINIFHGCYFGYAQALKPFVSAKAYRHLMKLADDQKKGAEGKYVIAVSKKLAIILNQQGIYVDSIIEPAIDTKRFYPAKEISRNDRCLFVGSFDYYGKGIDILEKIAGMGVKIDCIVSKRPSDKRLGWVGSVPNEELFQYYSRYKVLLFPSRFEGCGLVPLEAMACGTPIIMTPVGIAPDIAEEIPLFVVDASADTIPLKIVERLKEIDDNYDSLSIKARDYVIKHHNYDNWKKRWLKMINIVMDNGGT